MMNDIFYLVLVRCAWENLEAPGYKLDCSEIRNSGLIGYCPIYSSEEVARKEYPNHQIRAIRLTEVLENSKA